ncbi:hypothetical protein D3C85_1423820 [compost metagenome]
MQLFSVEFDFQAAMSARPMEFPLVQSPCCKPDAHAIVHQHFHPVGASVGKQIGAVRLRRTKYRDNTGQRRVGAGTHVHGFGGEPDSVDAYHCERLRMKLAQPSGSETGHLTVMDLSPSGSVITTTTST